MISAKCSFSDVRMSKARRRISLRSRGAVAAHAGRARSAASIAAVQSASVAIANCATVEPPLSVDEEIRDVGHERS
jgi:hypothetical protein